MFELAKPSFAEACPAATLAQALVFPILLGIKGNEESWLPDDALASIACRVVHVMFARLYGRDKPKGLVDYVKSRYTAAGKMEDYLKAVGDGALYIVLLAALATPESRSVAGLVQQADALSHVVNCADLIATLHPDDRSRLVQNVIIRDAAIAVNERAGALVAAMEKLTASMHAWDRLNPGRTSRSTAQRAGTVLWSSYGWEVTPRTPAETYCSGVNLETATSDNADMQGALDQLWQAMRIARTAAEVTPTEVQAQTDGASA